ncbi:MAG: hypothetical protein HOP07_05645 [Bacteriovoracaceae bacterium]|nr:hypothetical protein [Bacteriovoracaceae bacterium]
MKFNNLLVLLSITLISISAGAKELIEMKNERLNKEKEYKSWISKKKNELIIKDNEVKKWANVNHEKLKNKKTLLHH